MLKVRINHDLFPGELAPSRRPDPSAADEAEELAALFADIARRFEARRRSRAA